MGNLGIVLPAATLMTGSDGRSEKRQRNLRSSVPRNLLDTELPAPQFTEYNKTDYKYRNEIFTSDCDRVENICELLVWLTGKHQLQVKYQERSK